VLQLMHAGGALSDLQPWEGGGGVACNLLRGEVEFCSIFPPKSRPFAVYKPSVGTGSQDVCWLVTLRCYSTDCGHRALLSLGIVDSWAPLVIDHCWEQAQAPRAGAQCHCNIIAGPRIPKAQ
jgi:hypothetical protein